MKRKANSSNSSSAYHAGDGVRKASLDSNQNQNASSKILSEEDDAMKAKLSKRLYPSLPSWEIAICSSIWTFASLYAMYQVYPLSRKYYSYLAEYDLKPGWFGGVSKYRRDTSDDEWETFSQVMWRALPWFTLHFVGSQFLRKFNKSLVPLFNALLSVIYFIRNMGFGVTLSMLVQPVIFYAAYLTGIKSVMWAVSLATLLSLNGVGGPFSTFMNYLVQSPGAGPEREIQYICHVTWAWINARCTSFCLDKLDGVVKDPNNSKLDDFIDIVAHSLYVPCAVSGPIIVYRKFHKGMRSEYRPWTKERLAHLVLQIFRYGFWWFVTVLSLHFFHQNAFKYAASLMDMQDTWTVFGVGLAVSHFFHIKYVVFYGVPWLLAYHDGIEEAPRHPCCIARIHSYKDMWRYFDSGLYDFLIMHIYVPILGQWKKPSSLIKFASSSVVFLYIYVWHGLQSMIAFWALFNYTSVTLESIGQQIGAHKGYQSLESSLLSPQGKRRFYGLLATPLLLGSILANFVFLLGPELAKVCAKRALTAWAPTLFVLYSTSQFCIEVKNWKISNELHGFKIL